MDHIGPHTYCYLHHPLLSSGETMLHHMIAHLCFTGILKMDHFKVHIDADDPRRVQRLFLSRGEIRAPLSAAEAFAYDLLPTRHACSLGDLHVHMNRVIDDPEQFKLGPMQEDMIKAGLLHSTHTDSHAGRVAYRELHHLIKSVEKEEATLLEDHVHLTNLLTTLGSNVILLNKSCRIKLREADVHSPDLRSVLDVHAYFETGGIRSTKVMG